MTKNKNSNDASSLHLNPTILTAFNTELEIVLKNKNIFIELNEQLKKFDENLIEAAKSNEFIDLSLATDLQIKCKTILSLVDKSQEKERNAYLLAAVAYFLRADDASNDFQTVGGFEDDNEVIDAVLKKYNLTQIINTELEKKRTKGAIA